MNEPIGLWERDLRSGAVWCSAGWLRLHGVETAPDFEGWMALIHPGDRGRVRQTAARAIGSGGEFACEYRVVRTDGAVRSIADRARVVRDAAGRAERIAGAALDVTLQKDAGERLAMQTRALSRLAEGIAVCDAAGVVRLTNPAFDALCGCPAGELAGLPIVALLRALPEETRGQLAGMRRHVREHGAWTAEVRHVNRKGQAIIAAVSVTRAGEADSRCYVAVCQDITGRKRMQELARARAARIRELERQHGESEKLAAAGRMAARVAHEINNPLAGIKNSFLLVKDAIPPDYPYYSYVGRIEKEIDRIAGIVHQMYELHRPDENAPRPLALDEVVADVIALLAPDARENQVVLRAHLPAGPVAVVLPDGPLRQVLFNVITNAIEAAPPASEVKVAVAAAAGVAVVAVSDRGPGIAEELRTRVFEPFFSTKTAARGKGLGLGLAISHGLVESMGGSMDFENRAGGGTVFRIRLPLAGAARR